LAAFRKIAESGNGIMSRSSAKPDLNSADVLGKSMLMYAAAYGHKAIVEYILAKEVEVNAVDSTQKTALHYASKMQAQGTRSVVQADLVSLLIESGASLEVRDYNGCTPLMFAAANGNVAVVARLLLAQANINSKDFEGKSALDYAVHFGRAEMVQRLKDNGALGSDIDEDSSLQGSTHETGSAELMSESAASVSTTTEANQKKRTKKAKAAGEEGGEADGAGKGKKGKGEKKKKGTKKKSGAGQAGSAGMMEAAGRDEEGLPCEVVVEDDTAPEAGDESRRALARLQALLLGTSTSSIELEAAIEAARGAGAEEERLVDAKRRAKELRACAKARDKLCQAMEERSVKGLRKAIARARECALPASCLEAAEAALAEEEPRQQAREGLHAAQQGGDAEALRAAVAEARRVDLEEDELAEFEQLLAGAESKEKAEVVLRSAVEERNIAGLKFAIRQAKDAGVEKEQIKQAKAVLKEEEPKQRARDLLSDACEKCTISALEEALQAAESAGLEAAECSEAKALLQQEAEKQRLLESVQGAMQASNQVDTSSIDALREAKDLLGNTIKVATQAGVTEADLHQAESRRKKLHNIIEDLKGSIRVFCRVRPLSSTEAHNGDTEITKKADSMTLEVSGGSSFQFDAVFAPGTQEEVFDDCRDLVQSAFDGYNVTMFAYGQTGAGKTFTMYGAPGAEGTAPRTIQEVYRVIEQGRSRFSYTVMASMLELYRNDLVDLLNKGASGAKSKLNLRTQKSGGVLVENLSEEECASAEDLTALLERGSAQRAVCATAMNSESSRSHLVLSISIVSVNKETKERLRGKILICDLAGSERLKKSQVSDEQQKEAIEINKSLTALGDVVEALTKGEKVIPYRNHKLTQLMQDSLGGTAKTLMFVNCSPAASNTDETVMSLKYATRAKKITSTSAAK